MDDGPLDGILLAADLATGLLLLGSAVLAFRSSRASATLLFATGVLWFVGTLFPPGMFWHRGTLVHLLLAFPRGRPAVYPSWAVVGAGYAASVLLPGLWLDDVRGAAAGVVIVVAASWAVHMSSGRARHHRRVGLFAALVLGVGLAGGVLGSLLPPLEDPVAGLLVYELTVGASAAIVVAGLRAPDSSRLTDLIVDLDEGTSGDLRDDLARTLRDPGFRIGYWSEASQGYRDRHGREVGPPSAESGEAATPVSRNGRPFALLVHDAGLLADPKLLESVRTATRLTAVHVQRQAEVRDRIEAVAASRRRLVTAADDERQRLGDALSAGVERDLDALLSELRSAAAEEPGARHLAQATRHLELGTKDLLRLAAGLAPQHLDAGLVSAVTSLADGFPALVEVKGNVAGVPASLELACYFVCAEAISNVAKHAPGSHVRVEMAQDVEFIRLFVIDDGPGGARMDPGGGLEGLRDRVESFGGQLNLDSGPGGTRLVVELPLKDQPR